MRLAAGLFVALAAASAAAGWWSLVGFVLAAVFALAAGPTIASARQAAGERSWAAPVLGGARCAANVAQCGLFTSVCSAYVLPAHPVVGTVVAVAVLTVADAGGVRLPRYARRWVLGLLLIAAVGFLAVCIGLSPAPAAALSPPPSRSVGLGGVLLAAAMLFALLDTDIAHIRLRPPTVLATGGGLAVALTVGAAALYQLGPVRMGLSPTSLRDVLAAADAQALDPLLAAIVALATLPAGLSALARARESGHLPRDAPQREAGFSIGLGVLAAALAGTLGPAGALQVAAGTALAEVVLAAVVAIRRSRTRLALVVMVVAVIAAALLAALAPRYLLVSAAAVLIGAALIARLTSSRRGSTRARQR